MKTFIARYLPEEVIRVLQAVYLTARLYLLIHEL